MSLDTTQEIVQLRTDIEMLLHALRPFAKAADWDWSAYIANRHNSCVMYGNSPTEQVTRADLNYAKEVFSRINQDKKPIFASIDS